MSAIGRQLSILVLGTALGALGREAAADDAACQAVLDAVIKQATIPVHQKISIESASMPGKTLQSEMIRTGDTSEGSERCAAGDAEGRAQLHARAERSGRRPAGRSLQRRGKDCVGRYGLADLDFTCERIAAAPTYRDARAEQRQGAARRSLRLRRRACAAEHLSLKVRNRTGHMHNFVMG
jgi:hypothetical protein